MALSDQRKKEIDAIMAKRGVLPTADPRNERQGVLSTIAKDLAMPFARAGVNAYNLVRSVGTLGAAGIAKVAGQDEQAGRFVREAGQEARAVRNVPFLGEVKPVETIKDTIGTGLQIGSTIAGGGATKSLAGAGLKTIVKEGVKEGVKFGAATGAAYEAGRALSEDKSALETLQAFLIGGVGGAAIGGVAGAAIPVAGAGLRSTGRTAQKVFKTGQGVAENAVEKVRGIRNPIPGSEEAINRTFKNDPIGAIADTFTVGKQKVKNILGGSRENLAIRAEKIREGNAIFKQLPETQQSILRKGVGLDDLNLYEKMPDADKAVARRIVEAADAYESGNRELLPQNIADEYVKRLNGLGSVLESANKELDDTVAGLGGARLQAHETVNTVLERMSGTNGLSGINVNENGILDFTNTQLSGANSATARKELQKIFDDVVKRADDPEKLHLYRKELFEDLGGKKTSGIKLTGTEEKAVNAMRQGMADAIEVVAPDYKKANAKVAKLIDIQKDTNRLFGNQNEYSTEIFNERVSRLIRRLTNNTKSGGDIAQLIQDIENALRTEGISFDTNIKNIQEFVNILNKYYDIAPGTSLMGIIKSTNIPTSKAGIVDQFMSLLHEGSQATKDTAKQAIKEMVSKP